MVPFLDIREQNRRIEKELRAAVDQVIDNAQFILGPGTKSFEEAFAAYCGTKYCVGVNNGTSALHMALIANGIGPGDEVITTAHTWISTSWAISYVGATPKYVDIDPQTYNLDPSLVESVITPRTKAILPVHLYGQACELKSLSSICDSHNLRLIEDAAQAHGAKCDGKRVGSIGHIGCFSFYPGKNLGAFGEAGAVVTDDQEMAERIRRLRDHAQDGRHNHVELGFNTRMEGIQGAVLEVKLRHLDAWNEARRRLADYYRENLANVSGLRLPQCVDPQGHVWHLFVVLVDAARRDEIRQELADQGIATGVHYPTPVPLQPVYQHLGHKPGDFPVAEDVMAQCISLPMFPEWEESQARQVVDAVKMVVSNK
ncbi:DegT/DnrJ/EryC1/StrS family aminotransferase [Bremerella sp. JC770]|uniref:DegT/DnrJ/EryC1/StrS family aminotransferase n=1 Tax=Bremerella sp. JC770 TaxID=3232137 RepID=UPI003459C821